MALTSETTSPEVQERIRQLALQGCSKAEVRRRLKVGKHSIRKYWPPITVNPLPVGKLSASPASIPITPRLPDPAPEAGGPALPDPCALTYEPYHVDVAGMVGILCDPHIPYHDKSVIQKWVDECKKTAAKVIFLNGDVLDCYQMSDFVRERSKPRMVEEIEKGRQFLGYLRATFPDARIIYKEGNHDERLKRYIATRAPDLDDLPDIYLPSLLRAEQFGVEWVAEKRVVMVGKLPVIHGHEYQGGGGVMPARWLYLRTGDTALTGHFHQPSNYTFRTIMDREVGMWSVGCACALKPAYRPLNQWSHGYAMCEVSSSGGYAVENRRILKDGRVA